jgi:hypothetical protein
MKMKIFLSWSGTRSRLVAEALNDWLPRVIQAVKPFYSPVIQKGAKWSSEIDAALEGTNVGIVCLTPDNLASPWIHFEAGALSKTEDALVWTFLHGLTPSDIPPPSGKFQHTVAQRDDTLSLVKTINRCLDKMGEEPLAEKMLVENFEIFWPTLEERLNAAEVVSNSLSSDESIVDVGTQRDMRAIVTEILELVRNQERRSSGFENRLLPLPSDLSTQRDLVPIYYGVDIRVPSDGDSELSADIENITRAIREVSPFCLGAGSVSDGTMCRLRVVLNPPLTQRDCHRIIARSAPPGTTFNELVDP